MNKQSRKTLAFALIASLAAPLAFAQEAGVETDATAEATAAPAAQEAGAAVAADAGAATKLSWEDVDANKDGALSQDEAAAVPSLVQVFAQADADADGSLTADEYTAYVATVQAAGAAGGSAGQPAE